MPDFIGNIQVPEIAASGTFPIKPDPGWGLAHAPEVATHPFGSGEAKIEQRFLLGNGVKRYLFRRAAMNDTDRVALRDFWETHKGAYQPFTYNAPSDDGQGTSAVTVRFIETALSWEFLAFHVSTVGITFAEVPDPAAAPSYTLNSTVTRFPTSGLATALLSQVQEIIPLLKITVRQAGYPVIFLSDRRATVGGQLYQARLLEFSGISQSMGGESDEASFSFGNADRVMRDLANDADLFRASIEFSLFHVGQGIKLDLWKGEVIDWSLSTGPEFEVRATDGVYSLSLAYPNRRISRSCWKDFNDGLNCPAATQGGSNLGTPCDKGFDTAQGCVFHTMQNFFGGIVAKPQSVRLRDWSEPGLRKPLITSTSIVADSIYDKVLREIWCNIAGGDDSKGIKVNCDLVSGRDESDFYNALGVIGEGPLGRLGTGNTLDGQIHHGGNLSTYGLRVSLGADPNPDPFSLGEGTPQVYGPERAAGTAFIELRRSDETGIQPTRLDQHAMQAVVIQGLTGFTWTGAGARSATPGLTNPVWTAVNMLLRGLALKGASAAAQEAIFDVAQAVAAAAVCDTSVTKLVGSGSETQFRFIGVVQDEKPLRDWLQEALMNCLGCYTFSFGKIRIGVRVNASAAEAFTDGNMLFGSLQLAPIRPSYNHITVNFADEEFDFVQNSVVLYDIDHAKWLGGSASPVFLRSTLNLTGATTKSQALRVAQVRLKEELGGISLTEMRRARTAAWKTTVLALAVEPGMVVSITHPDAPTGSGKFRVTGWRLNSDYSIDLQGRSVTDGMYDTAVGPKPADVVVSPIPPEFQQVPSGLAWHPDHEAPASGDPMFDVNDKTFGLAHSNRFMADGSSVSVLKISGKLPVNSFIANSKPPLLGTFSVATTGGSLPGGKTYYVAVCAKDSAGRFTPPSNILEIPVPAGTSTNKITLSGITWPSGSYAGYLVFGAIDDIRMLTRQSDVTIALPSTIELTAAFVRSTLSFPSYRFSKLVAKIKRVAGSGALGHSGVVGTAIDSVALNKITVTGLADPGDNWAGRDLSVIADVSDGSAGVWNFNCTAYNTSTGEFTVTPDPQAAGVQASDTLIIRTAPTTVSSTTIGDAKYINKLAPSGLTVDAEKNHLVRIIAGPGRGQMRRILSNTATVLTVDRPWTTTPTSGSRFVVEPPDWDQEVEGSEVLNADPAHTSQLEIVFDNWPDTTVLVGVFAVDVAGSETPEELAVFRETFLYGFDFLVEPLTGDQVSRVDVINIDLAANHTMAIPGHAIGTVIIYVINQTGAANFTVTWPASFDGMGDYPMPTGAGKSIRLAFHKKSGTEMELLWGPIEKG